MKMLKDFLDRIACSVSFGHVFVTFDGKLLGGTSMVLSTVAMLCTVTWLPWAVPIVSGFIGSYGRGTTNASAVPLPALVTA